jgi:acetylornithine/N-succinyldiaminopimelate aminotransferase
MNTKQIFQQHLAQTSPAPIAIQIEKAEGTYLYDEKGKAFLDLIGGISVCNIGHSHPRVQEAIELQSKKYLHVMVYGELIQSPQSTYAKALIDHLPASLNNVYFTNSGAEACELSLKLAKRIGEGRPKIIAANNSYHGHTLGALSVMGSEYWRNAFRPLLPGVLHYNYNDPAFINAIDTNTSCVIVESLQSEAGIIAPHKDWMLALRQKCTDTGTLLILDEIQTGFGRTGTLWYFEQLGIVPDILLLGKALGGGLPMGAVISSKSLMDHLTHQPVLGHMTTFGGHPLCCAAGNAAFNVLLDQNLTQTVADKNAYFVELLKSTQITHINAVGLLIAVGLRDNGQVLKVIAKCLEIGLFTDWFLFADNCIRIAPPLTITFEEIEAACKLLLEAIASAE